VAPDSIGVPLVGPAGMPAQATEILRKAFLAMAHDKGYEADAEKVDQPVGSPIGGPELADMVARLASTTTTEVIAEFTRLSSAR